MIWLFSILFGGSILFLVLAAIFNKNEVEILDDDPELLDQRKNKK